MNHDRPPEIAVDGLTDTVALYLNGVFLKLCGAWLDRLTGGRYSHPCEQNQIGPLGQESVL